LEQAPNRDCAAKASNGEICCTYFSVRTDRVVSLPSRDPATKTLLNVHQDGTCDYTGGGDCAAGLSEYEDEYIAPFAAMLAKYNGKVRSLTSFLAMECDVFFFRPPLTHSLCKRTSLKVPVVLVIEPDSLPNLATNTALAACGDRSTNTITQLFVVGLATFCSFQQRLLFSSF
jgi:hypothetical protein